MGGVREREGRDGVRDDRPKKKSRAEREASDAISAVGGDGDAPAASVAPLAGHEYALQLKLKRQAVVTRLKSINRQLRNGFKSKKTPSAWLARSGRGVACPFDGVTPSPVVNGYRNKADFTIGADEDGVARVGFLSGGWDSAISKQSLSVPTLPASITAVATLFQKEVVQKSASLPPFNRRTNEGMWRGLTVRINNDGKECIVAVRVNKDFDEKKKEEGKELARSVLSACTDVKVTGAVWEEAQAQSSVATVEEVMMGDRYLTVMLRSLPFKVDIDAFFQVNLGAAELLLSHALTFASRYKANTLLDVCCGTGIFGMAMAKMVKKVMGVDTSAEAIEGARDQAKHLHLDNCSFEVAKAEEALEKWEKEGQLEWPCVAICDPPRCGLNSAVVHALRKCKQVKSIILISCGADAMVKDVVALCTPEKAPTLSRRSPTSMQSGGGGGEGKDAAEVDRDLPLGFFYPRTVTAIDLFPHTPHVETVTLLERSTLMMADNPTDVFDVDFCWTCGGSDHKRGECPNKDGE